MLPRKEQDPGRIYNDELIYKNKIEENKVKWKQSEVIFTLAKYIVQFKSILNFFFALLC